MPSLLASHNAATNIAVRDLEVARTFYADALGLPFVREDDGQVLVFRSGDSLLYVYKTEFAGTNQATTLTWSIDPARPADFDAIVAALQSKDVAFLHYPDLPNLTLKGDVHVAQSGNLRVVWFKDPDGNILTVANA
jgi:catechol 2,3-dioxygenase-like lactoylglutathione lyase family enzyme